MSAHPNLDPESFQNLLADAFAVQESGIHTESLSVVVDVQRSIETGEFDVGTMQLIAERVRKIANATGVAIGLLKGDQLVYSPSDRTLRPRSGINLPAAAQSRATTGWPDDLWRRKRSPTSRPAQERPLLRIA